MILRLYTTREGLKATPVVAAVNELFQRFTPVLIYIAEQGWGEDFQLEDLYCLRVNLPNEAAAVAVRLRFPDLLTEPEPEPRLPPRKPFSRIFRI